MLLTGESGCGKTTLTRVLNGLCPRFYDGELSGTYLLNDVDASTLNLDEIGIQIGNVFQDPRSQFFTTNTTDEIVLAMENRNYSRELMTERVEEMSLLLKLEQILDREIFNMSSGEKQKIAIAAACSIHPGILIMDEPSANLDLETTKQLTGLLKELKEHGFTIIISEHRFYYLYDLLDRMVVMKNGQIFKTFSKTEVQTLSDKQLIDMGLRLFRQEKQEVVECYDAFYTPMLEVKNLTFLRKDRKILDNISFSLYRGQISVITGENGIGKTTLCKIIVGILKEKNGTIAINGNILSRRKRMEHSFFVGQDVDYQLYTSQVIEEIILNLKNSEHLLNRAKEILEVLDLLEVQNRHPASLSGGQKQRVLLACALMRERSVLVLDEPTSGLDGKHMRIMVDLLRKAAQKGICILVITHDSEFIRLVADSLFYIRDGKLVKAKEVC